MSRPKGVMHPVSVRATKDASGGVQFDADSGIWDGSGKLVFNKDKHGMHKHDFHLVEFVLDDRTGERLHFPSLPHDAMWVERIRDEANPHCPHDGSKSDYDVIEPLCVCDEGQRLIVRNQNPDVEQWAFTLNFVTPGSDKQVSWDPIIQNNNHGQS